MTILSCELEYGHSQLEYTCCMLSFKPGTVEKTSSSTKVQEHQNDKKGRGQIQPIISTPCLVEL